MLESVRAQTATPGPASGSAVDADPRIHARRSTLLGCGIAAIVVGIAVAWVQLTDMRPSYDAFGWLVWGRQVLDWNLNTDGAPSWKPLTLVFTLPYALAGAQPQVWLWMITSTAGALAGSVFAARIAFRLTGPCPGGRWPAFAAGAFAAAAVLGMDGYSQQVLIANSDPMIVTLCLAAIDSHLSNRPRIAFALLVLAALGRPEAWAFAAPYAIWLVRSGHTHAVIATLALTGIGLAWFLVPGLTSHSWFISGQLAMNSPNAIHGNRPIGVIDRLMGLYERPMQVAVAYALVLAVIRRDRAWLSLAGTALLWVAIEIAMALHGWSAVPRYLMEPAAVLIVLAAAAIGWTLAYGARNGGPLLRWAPPIAFAALILSLVPVARSRATLTGTELHEAHKAAVVFKRLEEVIRDDGGARRIRSCGQPVTLVGYQAELAWALGMNVGNVGFRPGQSIDQGIPIVVFNPHRYGWRVRPWHLRADDARRCAVRIDSQLGDGS